MRCSCGQKFKGTAKKVFKGQYLCPRNKCKRLVSNEVIRNG